MLVCSAGWSTCGSVLDVVVSGGCEKLSRKEEGTTSDLDSFLEHSPDFLVLHSPPRFRPLLVLEGCLSESSPVLSVT